jgi:hypothetical protein
MQGSDLYVQGMVEDVALTGIVANATAALQE